MKNETDAKCDTCTLCLMDTCVCGEECVEHSKFETTGEE